MYGRRTRRMLRRIDPWSVLKVSLLFYLSLGTVTIVAGTVVYNVARMAGFMARIERTMQEVGFENFRFLGAKTLLAAVLLAAFGAVVASAATVLMSFMYNLISEIVGGIEISTLDELVEVVEVVPESGDAGAREKLAAEEIREYAEEDSVVALSDRSEHGDLGRKAAGDLAEVQEGIKTES